MKAEHAATAPARCVSLDSARPNGLMTAPSLSHLEFCLKHVNKHTLMNRWIAVEQSAHFVLEQKEKKAVVTKQCRIIVAGAKHWVLQVACGQTVEELIPTWKYCCALEQLIPQDMSVGRVEKFVSQCITELHELPPDASQTSSAEEVEEEEQMDVEDENALAGVQPQISAAEPASKTSSTAPTVPAQAINSNASIGFKLVAPRPSTREEWRARTEVMQQVKRNRTIAAMAFTAVYTFLMRILSFDAYLLLLFFLEVLVFYVMTHYKDISIHLGKRVAASRVNRLKDWFTFALRRKKEKGKDHPHSDSEGEEQ